MRGMNPCMRLVLTMVLVVVLAACDRCGSAHLPDAGAIDAGPPVVSEKEPNDGPNNALALDRSSLVEGNLGADPGKPDEDWYVLKAANQPKTVSLTVTCPPGADVALEIVDESRAVLATINSGGPGAPERYPNLDVSSRTFVRVVGHKKGAGGAYVLNATFVDRSPGFEFEPNDRKVDATAVPLGQAISGFIAHGGDQDWFRFELPSMGDGFDAGLDTMAPDAATDDAGATAAISATVPVAEKKLALRIDVSPVEGVAFDLQLLTEAEAVLFAAKSAEGAGLSLRNIGVRATDRVMYIVLKTTGKKGFNASTYYTLTVSPEETSGVAEFEPNDEPGKATDVAANSTREGFISPRGDVDYYRLVTDGPSIARLQVTGVEKLDVVLSVVRMAEGKPEEVLLKANEGGVKEPEQLNDVFCDGSCLIRVDTATKKIDGKWVRDDENADQAYKLLAAVSPDDGSEEREPNHASAPPSPLTLGKPIRGTIYPKKDVDYFSLDLRNRPVKTPIAATLLGILKVDVGLYLHHVEADGTLTLVQTSDGAKGEKAETIRYSAEPGLYAFEVRDAKNREANFQDSYQLLVEESGD